MSRDQRLFFYSLENGGIWETLGITALLGLSPSARSRQKQYIQVKKLFSDALSEPDTVYHLKTKTPWSAKSKPLISWVILALLVAVAVYEWRSFTLPAVNDWASTVLHRCGL